MNPRLRECVKVSQSSLTGTGVLPMGSRVNGIQGVTEEAVRSSVGGVRSLRAGGRGAGANGEEACLTTWVNSGGVIWSLRRLWLTSWQRSPCVPHPSERGADRTSPQRGNHYGHHYGLVCFFSSACDSWNSSNLRFFSWHTAVTWKKEKQMESVPLRETRAWCSPVQWFSERKAIYLCSATEYSPFSGIEITEMH